MIGSWQGKHHTLPLPLPLQHSYGWPHGFIVQDLEFPLFPVCLHIYHCSSGMREDMIFQKIKPNPKLFLQVSVPKSDRFARLDGGGILNGLVQTTCVVDEEAESERGRIICWSFVKSLALAGNGALWKMSRVCASHQVGLSSVAD